MNRLVKASIAAFALSLMLVGPASAGIRDIRDADKAIEFDIGAATYRYGETYGGQTQDTEKGTLPGFKIEGAYLGGDRTSWAPMRNIYVDVSFQAVFGDTSYDGGLQNLITGTVTPLHQTDRAQVYDASVKIGHGMPVTSYLMLIPFGDFGIHSWYRTLTGVGGYSENYLNGELQAGLMAQISPFPKWVFSLTGEGGTTLFPQMTTGGDTYKLGSQMVYTLSGKVSYALTPSLALTGSLGFKGFGYGVSPVVNGALEPDSYTHEASMMAGVAYLLK